VPAGGRRIARAEEQVRASQALPGASLGALLRQYRLAAGLSQEALAEMSAVSARTIANLERGRTTRPYPQTIRSLANALGIPEATRERLVRDARLRAVHDSEAAPDPRKTGGADDARRGTEPAGRPGRPEPMTGITCSLPPDTAAFIGRSAELDLITSAAVRTGRQADGTAAILAISGMPGIGKTALALRAAHLLTDRFPDRQLFVDLHGHTPGRDPVAPADALAELLIAAGVDPRNLPASLEGRSALWRDRLAGQQTMLLLDNAASSAQVAPLLPGRAGILVLVTSRRYLADLPGAVVPVVMEVLRPDQAAEMFIRLAPRAAADDADAVAELVELAGSLPLAISLLARLYDRHPAWGTAELLAETRTSMLTLSAEQASVAAAFEVSWRHLDPNGQDLFGCLGLHPGIGTDAYAAAALADVELPEAARLLDRLHAEGLLTETGHRRYGMHDLIRRYAADRSAETMTAEASEAALARLLDYYQNTAACAQALLARQPRTRQLLDLPAQHLAAPKFADGDEALAWARAERSSLVACLDYAMAAGLQARVVALTASMAELLRRDGPWTEAMARHAAAAAAATDVGDRHGRANALLCLGEVQLLGGDHPAAAATLNEGLEISRDLGDRLGQGMVLFRLGGLHCQTGDYQPAARALAEALCAFREVEDRLGQANVLAVQAYVKQMAADYRGAADTLAEALNIYRDLGDRHGEANVLYILGRLEILTHNHLAATDTLTGAEEIYRGLGDRNGEVNVLNLLAYSREMTADYAGAAQAVTEAADISRDLGYRLGEANALYGLGALRRQTGDYQAAVDALASAMVIYRDLGDQLGRANALVSLGSVRRLAGDYQAAGRDLAEGLEIHSHHGHRGGVAEALNETGSLRHLLGDPAAAAEYHHQALDLAMEIAMPLEEGRALAGLGRCALATGNRQAAVNHLDRAHTILKCTGSAEADIVAGELNEIRAATVSFRD
jgi:tetratricopeptide (TPR) repeat protein/transcriptional regulator with XRE-family HTH domain